jgi:hydrophobic/amphiphilic exporter-1 (mainly G- bacteria), HAE1 family
MWFTRLAISRPIVIWMVLAAIAVLGVRAYLRLPAELNPRVSIPTVTVTTAYPGAGPPEIETQVSKPLEDAVGTAPGVKDVYSSSQANVSIISMDFQSGSDVDVAVADVRSKVEAVRAQLPAGVQPPVVAKLDINALPILYSGLECPSLTLQQLRALADNTIRPRLERVPGVASVQVVGGEQREIHVAVDGQKLAQYGFTIEDIVNSLKASGRDVPSGGISHGKMETDVRLAGAYSSLKAIRDTQILSQQSQLQRVTAGAPGSPPPLPIPPLTVADVAAVRDTRAERSEINRIDGVDGVSLVVTKAYDANTVAVVDEINRAFDELQKSVPADLRRIVLNDSSETVREALADVNVSLILGAVLAMFVILLFLHNVRGTLIVSLAIPACVVATFLMMQIVGFTLNQMTLLALSLSVGILVDDSIVILESITRHLSDGRSPREAALRGRSEIGFADLTTTLVDVVVFVPIAFMGGIVGSFFKQFGLTIAFATLFSLLVSFSITPMLASRWYRRGENMVARRGMFAPFERFYQRLEATYRGVIAWSLQHRRPVVATGLACLALIFVLSFRRLGFEFMPGSDQGQLVVNLEMPPGTSLAGTNETARRMERIVIGTPDVEATVTNVGQVLGNFGAIPQQGVQFAQMNVRLREKRGILDDIWPTAASQRRRARSDEDVARELRHRLQTVVRDTGAIVNTLAVRSVVGAGVAVAIQLRGADSVLLTSVAEQLRDRIRAVPGIVDPDVSARSGKPEVRVEVDPNRAAQFGIAPGAAGAILRDSLSGNTETVFRQSGQEFPIRVQLEGIQRDDPEQIKNIIVGSDAQGSPVSLADIADTIPREGPTNIDRNNGQRLVTVTANLAAGTPLGNVRGLIQKQIDALPHEGITIHWSGEAETMDENAPIFAGALGLAILLVYFVMAALFNNLMTPFVIMFTLPMALVGALGALVVTGETLSLVSCIGILMLVGLMGRNAILLLDYANTLRKRGMSRTEAIVEAGTTRLRPILMTTTATIVGMLPVAMRVGRASEVRAPMAIVVIGGLLVSTVLTLVVIPVLYSLFDDWFGGKRRHAATTSIPPISPEPEI